MSAEQLFLWERTPEEKLRDEFEKLKDSNTRMRKSQFAKIGEQAKRIDALEYQIQEMKHMFYVLEKCYEEGLL